jgi:hypothetical protein
VVSALLRALQEVLVGRARLRDPPVLEESVGLVEE